MSSPYHTDEYYWPRCFYCIHFSPASWWDDYDGGYPSSTLLPSSCKKQDALHLLHKKNPKFSDECKLHKKKTKKQIENMYDEMDWIEHDGEMYAPY